MLPESRLQLLISLKIQSFFSYEEKHDDENMWLTPDLLKTLMDPDLGSHCS